MITLGVDPGTRHLGWGVVHVAGNRLRHLAHGVVDVSAALPLAERLEVLDRELARIIAAHRPAAGSVETIFFHRDAQAAAKLGHARGVVLLALARAKVPVYEYAPAHVKRAITGKGNADKRQVAHMVEALLALDAPPRSDAADALALAVTHGRRSPLEAVLAGQRAVAAGPHPLRLLLRRGRTRLPGRPSAR